MEFLVVGWVGRIYAGVVCEEGLRFDVALLRGYDEMLGRELWGTFLPWRGEAEEWSVR